MIHKLAKTLAIAGVLWSASAAAQTAADLQSQLSELLKIFPGTYDNAAQIKRQGADQPFYPVRTILKHVTMPDVGDAVLYLEEYRDNDPSKFTRIRLYKFTVDETEKAIRLHLVNPLKPEALIGAHADLKLVESLKESDLRKDRDLCDVLIRKEGEQFIGHMKERSCNRPDQTWVDYTLVVAPGKHWVRNRARAPQTNQVVWEFVPGSGDSFIEQAKLP